MDGKSLDVKREKIEKLKAILPEVFTEGKVDVEKLKHTLGEDVNINNERYVLNWAGKGEAFKALQTPTTATLAPAPEESINFEKTNHVFIEGENLEVLKALQKSYYGKVKMIYIDPPYNTGNDNFIYPDRFSESKAEYLKRIGEKDEEGYLLKEGLFRKNSKENGQFHSNWLSMMYPRLFLARNLLRDDGVIFVSIDDNEVHNLRLLMNEIFGEENFLCQMIWNLRSGTQAGHFTRSHEYIVSFMKNKETTPYFDDKNGGTIRHGALKKISKDNPASEITFPQGIEFEGSDAIFRGEIGGSEKQYIISNEMIFKKGKLDKPVTLKAGWAMRDQVLSWIAGNDTFDSKGQKVVKFYFNSSGILWYEKERETIHPKTVLPELVGNTKTGSDELSDLLQGKYLDFPKPSKLIKFLIEIVCNNKNDLILDFFAGSATTAHAVMELNKEDGNRRFICVQLLEKTDENSEAYKAGYKTIADIGKERIRRVVKNIGGDLGFKVFKLRNSNFKIWRSDLIENGDDLAKQLDVFENPVKPEAAQTNMLWEILLKSGYDLNTKVGEKKLHNSPVYSINGGEMIIALAKIDEPTIKAIVEQKPQRCICLDSLFASNDQLKTNTALQMKDAGVEFKTI